MYDKKEFELDKKDFPIGCIVSFPVYTGSVLFPETTLYGEVIEHYAYLDNTGVVVKCEEDKHPRNVSFGWLTREKD